MNGCVAVLKKFCFPVYYLEKRFAIWTKGGMHDLKHLEKCKKHEESEKYMKNVTDSYVSKIKQ